MTSTRPLVSVVIPTRNRLALLQRAIDSVEAQTYPNVEIVLVDNHADVPLTRDQIKSSRPITIARTPTKLLLPLSRNFGADRANGEFVSFLDDDDEIMPGKIEAHVAAFASDPTLGYVYGNTRHIGPDGSTLVVASGPPELVPFLRWRYIHTNALTLRKSVFDALRYNSEMSTYEDVEFTARLIRGHKGAHIPDVHAKWYRDNRPDQITRPNYRRAYDNWRRLCRLLDDVIASDRDLRRFYHRKMFVLSVMYADVAQAGWSLLRAI